MMDAGTRNIIQMIEDTVSRIDNARNAVNNEWANSEDVKSGRITAEDEKNEPGHILYNSIIDSTIEVLKMPATLAMLHSTTKELEIEAVGDLMSFMSLAVSTVAYEAVTRYDSLLKNELTKQLDLIVNKINEGTAEIMAHKSVLEVHAKRLNGLEAQLKIAGVLKDE